MSDKKRRDITLGEMQDECKKYWNNGNLGSCGKCQYMEVCCHYEDYAPARLNLADPPRFNEQQMALLRGLLEAGARKMIYHPDIDNRWIKFEREDRTMIACVEMKALGYEAVSGAYEHNLLAELLGKDGADAKA